MNSEQDELAAKFLLGKLTEEEQTRIEEDFFKDNPSFENILIAENELIDAYVTGNLSLNDRARFEERLLLNPQQKQRVEFAKTLIGYASISSLSSKDSSSSATKPTFLTLISQFFFAKPMLSVSFAAFALFFFVGAIWWTANNNLSRSPNMGELAKTQTPDKVEIQETLSEAKNENRQLENKVNTQIEAVNNNDSASLNLTKTKRNQFLPKNQTHPKDQNATQKKSATIISTVILSLGATTRGSENAAAVEIPAKANLVNLHLKFDEGDFRSYYAVLETVEGQQLWSGKVFKSRKGRNEKSAILTVPARFLKKGDYILTLKGLNKNGIYESVADYSFNVARQ